MVGKIARIKNNFSGEDIFKVEYGFKKEEIVFGEYTGLKYATIKFSGAFFHVGDEEDRYDSNIIYTYICGGHYVEDKEDGFKRVIIYNSSKKLSDSEKEEYLLVIIPWAYKYEAPEERIAGRYPEEAILVLKPGQTITLYSSEDKKETFIVVSAGNELFLIKKRR